jgi:hypothetical protein
VRSAHPIALGTVLVLAACNTNRAEIARQHIRLDKVGFDVPASWKLWRSHAPHALTLEWVPEDNARKESLVVVRSTVGAALPQHGAAQIPELLRQAQLTLPQVRGVHLVPVERTHLVGFEVAEEFTPLGAATAYHRDHAVFIDGPTLVHVIYTAIDPEPAAFELAITSLQHEEG